MVRASVIAEKAGIPTVTDICSAFVEQSKIMARIAGVPGAPIAEYPGHIDIHTVEQRNKFVEEKVLPQIIEALTGKVKQGQVASASDPAPRDTVFSGTFDEINAHFYQKQWSDGLPIVPPTIERVEEFLRFTDRSPDQMLGVLQPSNKEATVWSVAVNGVMAGCRPEYMPILVAMVEVMGEPRFGLQTAGATPGWEAQVILNGPIVKQLGFNYQVGALRPGYMANSTVGRFWRLYVRNVPGFIPGSTDKGTWGRNFNVVLAENEDALKEIGWEPLSVIQGFNAGDNVVTVMSVRGRGYDPGVRGSTAKENVDTCIYALVTFQRNRLHQIKGEQALLLGLTPLNAAVIARDGFPTKKSLARHIWEKARLPASVMEAEGDDGSPWKRRNEQGESLCDAVRLGILPAMYCESNDPERLVPLWRSPEELLIVVSGDPGRNRALITASNIDYGLPTSKRITVLKR